MSVAWGMFVGTVDNEMETGEWSGLIAADSAFPDLTVAIFELVPVFEVEDIVPDGTPPESVVAVAVSAGSISVDLEAIEVDSGVRRAAELLEEVEVLHKVAGSEVSLLDDADLGLAVAKAFAILLPATLVTALTSALRTLSPEPPEVRFSRGGPVLKKNHFEYQMVLMLSISLHFYSSENFDFPLSPQFVVIFCSGLTETYSPFFLCQTSSF